MQSYHSPLCKTVKLERCCCAADGSVTIYRAMHMRTRAMERCFVALEGIHIVQDSLPGRQLQAARAGNCCKTTPLSA